MQEKKWQVDYQGNLITITHQYSLFSGKSVTNIAINQTLIKQQTLKWRPTSTVNICYPIQGKQQQIQIRIAQRRFRFNLGMQLYINKELVAGDKAINYPVAKEAIITYQKGLFRYLIKATILPAFCLYLLLLGLEQAGVNIAPHFYGIICGQIAASSLSAYLYWKDIKEVAELTLEENSCGE